MVGKCLELKIIIIQRYNMVNISRRGDNYEAFENSISIMSNSGLS